MVNSRGTSQVRDGELAVPTGNGSAFDLAKTVESGQTFCWRRDHGYGTMYDDHDGPIYITVLPATETDTERPEAIRVYQPAPNAIAWEARFDAGETVRQLLRLDDDLHAIHDALPNDAILDDAFEAEYGLRVPNDPVFPTLIAFICSSQMRVPRIHAMQLAMAEDLGSTATLGDHQYAAFPTPAELAEASEDALRDLSLGYRAPYAKRTAEMVATGECDPTDAEEMSYADAHALLKEFVGVGDKVADCVQLYALGHLNAFPVDTWVQTALDDHYPDLNRKSYAATVDAAQEYFGDHAGYAQSYLFTYLREE